MRTEALLLLASGCASALLCALLIPVLRRVKAGQYILGYVREHEGKAGTPTMGGLAFLCAAALVALAFGLYADKRVLVAVTFGLAYAAVGFLDDLLKARYKRNLGLRAYQKVAFQLVIALIAGFYCYFEGMTALRVPFSSAVLDVGWGIVPLVAFAFVATTNCVNLTDGLDGLAASVGAVYFAVLAALIFSFTPTEGAALARMSLVLCGALAGYLVFNTYRASLFMGDTGSLSLGGSAAAIAAFSGNLLYIAVVGIMFVLSGISVIAQVIYYKRTKKRLLLMAPLHHHFQQKGYAESKIVFAYAAVTAAAGLLCLLFV